MADQFLFLELHKEKIEERIESLARYINLPEPNFDGFMKWILDLRNKLAVPHTLKELIKEDKRFEEMSVMAFNDPSTGGNPTQLSDKDFLQLYKNAYNGIL